MNGTLLALILSPLLAVGLAFALLELRARKQQPEAQPKRKRHEPEYVTHEELREAIAEATKEMTFEWNEWYEKFDKLHLRLAKRAKRAEKVEEVDQEELGFDAGERPSVLHFRRMGSV